MSEDTVIGAIERVSERTTQYGVMYDVEINGKRYGHGKIKPKFLAGDCVKFSVLRNGQYTNVKPGTMEKHDVEESSPATAVLGKVETATPERQDARPAAAKPDTYANKEDSRQNSIVLQSARKDAIEVTKLLLQADATGIKAKDTWATKHELLLALVNDLTRRYYHNVVDWKDFTGPTPPKIAAQSQGDVSVNNNEEEL